MDLQVSELILTHPKLAYLKTDARLNITEAGGSFEILQYFELKNQALHAVNAKSPGQGAYYTVSNTGAFGAVAFTDIFPSVTQYSNELLNVLHGLEPELRMPSLTLAIAGSMNEKVVNVRTVPQKDRAGRIAGLIHLLEDVTDIRSLRRQIEHLGQSIEMLQNQLDMAAHELGTPLTLISGYLEILSDISGNQMTAEQRQCMELIEGSVDNLHIMVKSLFDIVFAEADGLRLALQPVDISQVVNGAVIEFQHQLERKSQQIVVKNGRPHANALCDQTRIIQVLNNLLSNASKFSPAGSTIEIEITSDIDDDIIQVAITDNGSGVDNKEHSAIFDRFYRTQFGKRAEAQGAGLGLYLCRMIIHMHGGEIWCQDATENGSTFCFTLPCTDLPLISSENMDMLFGQNGTYSTNGSSAG